jgi:hypothetical protein
MLMFIFVSGLLFIVLQALLVVKDLNSEIESGDYCLLNKMVDSGELDPGFLPDGEISKKQYNQIIEENDALKKKRMRENLMLSKTLKLKESIQNDPRN